MGDYVALLPIQAPGTLVMAYGPGDPVTAQVVNDWGLTDEQVKPAEDFTAARPTADTNERPPWEAYVIGQGTSVEDAHKASLDELKAMYDPPPPPAWQLNDAEAPVSKSDRPVDSAKKEEWIAWAVANGASEGWAYDPATTKDDLKNWQP